MSDTLLILRDIALEAHTTGTWLEYDDPLLESIVYIEDMAKRAIDKLEEESCG